MALEDIYDTLKADLEAGTWSNYHGTTPSVWKFDAQQMGDLERWAKKHREGIVVKRRDASALNLAGGSLFGEWQRASILVFSSTDSGIVDNLRDDLVPILEAGDYFFEGRERHDGDRLHYFISRVKLLVIN